MALVVKDRVKETTTTTGTGTVTLSGAATGFQTFNSAIGVGNTTYYCIAGQGTSEWEVGLGTLATSTTLARTTVYASSNAGSAVNFSAGTKDVFCTYPAGKSVSLDSASVAKVWGQAGVTGNLIVGYNVTSITDVGTGQATVVVGTDFSTDYCAICDCSSSFGTVFAKLQGTPSVGSFSIITSSGDTGAAIDPDVYLFCAFGAQV